MKSHPTRNPPIKIVRMPESKRFIYESDECDVTFHFKNGNKPTNVMINWMIDRIKLTVHS